VNLSQYKVAVGALSAALVVTVLFAFSYVGALHDPHPRRTPVAVIDARSAAAVSSSGSAFVPRVYGSEGAVRAAMRRRDVLVALLPPRLLVASAGGYAGVQAATIAFTKAQPSLRVVDIAPLSSGDPRGLTLFYLAVALIFGGYVASTFVAVSTGPRPQSSREAAIRVGLMGAFSIVAGFLCAVVVGPLIGAMQGHAAEVGAIGALVVFAAATATSALQSLLGQLGTVLAMAALLLLGNPSAGLYPGSFVPGFWRSIGPWLPGSAALSAFRGTVYFDGVGLGKPLLVLSAFVVVGAVGAIALGARRGAAPSTAVAIEPRSADTSGDGDEPVTSIVPAHAGVGAANGSVRSSSTRPSTTRSSSKENRDGGA
jgi:hypothetical protein